MNEPLPYHFTRLAEDDVLAADQWWRVHHPAVASVLEEMLAEAIAKVRLLPHIGKIARNPAHPFVRKLRLRVVPFDLHYQVVNDPGPTIQIVAVWHHRRGKQP